MLVDSELRTYPVSKYIECFFVSYLLFHFTKKYTR